MSGNTKRIALVALVALLATATLASLSVWAEESPPLPPVAWLAESVLLVMVKSEPVELKIAPP